MKKTKCTIVAFCTPDSMIILCSLYTLSLSLSLCLPLSSLPSVSLSLALPQLFPARSRRLLFAGPDFPARLPPQPVAKKIRVIPEAERKDSGSYKAGR